MGSQGAITWLDKLEEQINVDVDWMDPEYIKSMPIVPHDQTSNQLWVDIQLGHESNRHLFLETAKELKNEGWLAIYTRMVSLHQFLVPYDGRLTSNPQAVLMCKKNINSIRGRVLLQTLPSNAYKTQETLDHARLYDREFAKAGIGRDRYCIKIPSTGPALNAAKILSSEGIPTLGTALFSLPQAIACSQAGMLYISPYYNGRPGEGVPKPVHVYKDIGPTPERLKKLATIDPLAAAEWDGNLARTDVDYLADGGAALQKAIEADPVTTTRLSDALKLFIGGEKSSQGKIEEVLKQI
ncbi:transaldolase [Colletotrichum abscissum]|uniref:Transaldolase n=1 Tax=Colletotrichum abscissum TaxID=1671311 RepID=A0A9P9XDF8_9PEZI|nr:transaldolase [Colletotrichum abscissum]